MVGGRFLWFAWVSFILLRILPFPLGFTRLVGPWWNRMSERLAVFAADHIFHIGFDVRVHSGGGEPTQTYVLFACFAGLAIVAGIAGTWLVPKRTDLARWDQRIRGYVRLFLCWILLTYGWGKVFPSQFPAVGPERLIEYFGELSPPGLLWAFMGYSRPYMAFAGAGEVLAGILICFRRTTTLGALIGIAVMSNVVALNIFYDVGVKLGSSFYLATLAWLALPDAKRLANVLLLNRPTSPAPAPNRPRNPMHTAVAFALYWIAAIWIIAYTTRSGWMSAHTWGQWAPRPTLYGMYDVESVSRNGVTHDLTPPDSTLWRTVAIGQQRSTIRLASGTLGFFVASVDEGRGAIRFESRDDPERVYDLKYSRPGADGLTLSGEFAGDTVIMRLRRRDETAGRLLSHRFHWAKNVNENR